MNSFERREHRSEPISTWQARDQQVADLAFLQKNKPLGVTRAYAFYRCVLRDNDYEAQVVLSYFGRDLAQRSVAFLLLATLGTR